ncbi:pyrroline-5-carboxylate reductase [Caulochytrium protostelioides]|uniref:Pyrroline-5-carboxylate reductase n=1 Tax=Caulochytrium protostelioides TaxID=1555241 RepID=A0A4P9WV86_9FUNG|nr:pyrroline-5-carboxylate reductase [Caulochytrium protostelioides]
MLKEKTIAFIGGGNMATAIIGGLVASGVPASALRVSEPVAVLAEKLASKYAVHIAPSNAEAVAGVDAVLLAVKPQVMHDVVTEIAPALEAHGRPVIISIAAGISAARIEEWYVAGVQAAHAGEKGAAATATTAATTVTAPPVVRVMPNTPCMVRQGAVGMFASAEVAAAGRDLACAIMASTAPRTYWLTEEALMDAVTAVSGSGPAYFFLFVEAMTEVGIALGLPEDVAAGLASQTCRGAGEMLVAPGADNAATLRKNVTSPNGTTQAAIETFEKLDFRAIVAKALTAARDRGVELDQESAKKA